MHENTQARVLSSDGETDWFEITAGVLQGDTLAQHPPRLCDDRAKH